MDKTDLISGVYVATAPETMAFHENKVQWWCIFAGQPWREHHKGSLDVQEQQQENLLSLS